MKGVNEVESLGADTRSNRSVCVEDKKERESMIGLRINWPMKATEGVPLCGAQWVLPALVRTRGFVFTRSAIFQHNCQDNDDKAKRDLSDRSSGPLGPRTLHYSSHSDSSASMPLL